MDYVLTAEELYKEYKGGRALDGLSLHVPRGAIYGLVGKNGAGKTTLIRILCALQAPTAGEYTIFGVNGRDRGILQARGRMGAVVEAVVAGKLCLYPKVQNKIYKYGKILIC